ncbi:acyltransferase family protein [Leifsonia shinshuensis]|uniref:Peptidoglycan/LPS O-acetylase OafA/YrhL n=1 Tax=Leifsonia shinshuensis TaxID=150026 RepID=A0A853CNR7_9MICO|nr:acyltransferase [Leifsonia shinshuensis]NYJ21949.1 peptidoglycan/LPS O-acetylase OafA/YrhL [Leifsonia shinshuensis]
MPIPTDDVASTLTRRGARRATPHPRLAILDLLRLAAALSVVAYHWLFWGIEHGAIHSFGATPVSWLAAYGFLGVQLFFLISGFVIFLSASGREASAFAAGRATRLYPAYWAGVALTSATLLVTGQTAPLELLPKFLANLTMAPAVFRQPQLDGVYWTLTLELQFYALVFLFLLFRRRRWLDTFFPLWAIGMLGTTLFVPRVAALPLCGDLFTLFAGGAIIAMISRSGWTALRAAGLLASVVGGVVATIRHADESGDGAATDPVALGVVVVLLFVLVLVLTRPAVAALPVPGSRFLGALTYPLYLSHAVFGYALLNRWVDPGAIWPGIAAALLVVLGVAAAVHFLVERAGAPLWRSLFRFVFSPVARLEARSRRTS